MEHLSFSKPLLTVWEGSRFLLVFGMNKESPYLEEKWSIEKKTSLN